MKKIALLITLLLSASLWAFSQEADIFGASIIQVKECFEMKSTSSGTYTVHKKVLVIKPSAESEGSVTIFTDADRTLSSFSGTITKSGKVMKKLRKQDLESRAMAEDLADDVYLFHYQADVPLPYTLEYEYTINYRKGIATFPSFIPVSSDDVYLSEGEYVIKVPSGTKIQYRSPIKPDMAKEDNADVYTFRCNAFKGFTKESLMPDILTMVPYVMASPLNFMFSKVEGIQGDWKSVGEWSYDLQKDTWDLSNEDKSKIKQMTSDCKSDLEKVKVLYDYLRQTTRYVSIQLGIGGYKPFPASTVARTGFGDCKALSNYLKTMLDVAGVKSIYYIVNTNRADLGSDYSSIGQMNHVMLAVPVLDEGPCKGDTLWLECTNPIYPLGYKHEDIAGHQVVLVKESGGEMVRCSRYPDSLSRTENNVRILLSATGDADIEVLQKNYLDFTESFIRFASLSEKSKVEKLSSNVVVAPNGLKITDINNNFDDYPLKGRSFVPNYNISYNFKSIRYAESSSGRLFVPISPLKRGLGYQRGERKNDIWIESGFTCLDSISIAIPVTYELEGLPKSVNIDCDWAKFSSSISVKDGSILVVLRTEIIAGKYPKETYAEYGKAARKFNSMCNAKIVFKKKQN